MPCFQTNKFGLYTPRMSRVPATTPCYLRASIRLFVLSCSKFNNTVCEVVCGDKLASFKLLKKRNFASAWFSVNCLSELMEVQRRAGGVYGVTRWSATTHELLSVAASVAAGRTSCHGRRDETLAHSCMRICICC